MDFQHPNQRYMRPPPPLPPPSMADPHHQPPPPMQQQQQQPHPPQGSTWFSTQFQYHHPSQQSPSPPPPHNQWGPPPHSDHLPPPPPPPPPYSHNPYSLHNQYPPLPLPPRPHLPPPPHPHPHSHSQIPQSYPHVNQDWGNSNWGHHQGWEYPAQNNEEDWAAKARAWAAAKVATDTHHPQSQFTPNGRPEELSHYHDQYPQNVDVHYADAPQPSHLASSYQQYPAPAAPPHRPPDFHVHESASISTGQSSYVPDGHFHFTSRDGTLARDSNAVYRHQEFGPTSPLVHQQEVPSSYSSVTGKEESGDQNEKFYKSLPSSIASTQGQHHLQPPFPPIGRSVSMEQTRYAFGSMSAEPITDLSDQPLDFAPRFNRDNDPHLQPSYPHTDSVGPLRGVDPVASVPSVHSWTSPVAAGAVYPPVPPVHLSGQQYDPSIDAPSSIPGHSAPIFGRMPGPSFPSTIPTVGAPFGIGTGTALHPTTGFPGDVYGVSSVSERPKKGSVPNWLREEIIKKKAAIGSSALEHPKEESQYIEDESVDKSLGKGDQADSKSIDSSRSTEEEDDDEDYVEVARTAAINQEIKRVLTEVLLKVTDDLFDEIATKVLSEDDLSVEVKHNVVAPPRKVSPSTPAVPTPKASAKVLIPAKTNEIDTEDVSGKSTSSSPGDVLGLGSYASDDDEDDEIPTTGMPNSNEDTVSQRQSIRKLSEDVHAFENGSSKTEAEKNDKGHTNKETDPTSGSPNGASIHHSAVHSELSTDLAGKRPAHGNVQSRHSSKMVAGVREDETDVDGEKMLYSADPSLSKDSVGEKTIMQTERLVENVDVNKSRTNDSQDRETRKKPDKNDRREAKRSSAGKDFVKEVESGKDGRDNKGDETHKRQDERHARKERTDDLNGSKERMKEHGVKSVERAKDYDSRKKSSHPDVKEDRKENERDKKASAKEDSDRKRARKDDKGERKHGSESSRHKRHRSSSIGSRGRNSKDNSVVSYANDSSDEPSDDSKRKLHSRRRNLSPSPIRSRRRSSVIYANRPVLIKLDFIEG
ncbi:nucleolar protein NET1 isoform X2 [Cornus florida]|uniref:nucleolar protein NET1 isoform X2 n=1 Tax=Cornus florida TaxID=4283 RepID=UPI00289DBE37|nr:nucleolar protein NET1 isoform X2 [Cornus florida]